MRILAAVGAVLLVLAVSGWAFERHARAANEPGECAPGGKLDLHPDTPDFPIEARPGPLPAGLYGPQL